MTADEMPLDTIERMLLLCQKQGLAVPYGLIMPIFDLVRADLRPAPVDVESRIKGIQDWLYESGSDCFKEQKHLDDGPEKEYWHYGYMMALKDVQRKLIAQTAEGEG